MTIELDEIVEMDDDAVLPFRMDWSEWIAEESDTFTGVPTITVLPTTGLAASSASYDGDEALWWLTATATGTYRITVHVTTSGGRVDERTVTVVVRER